ncbi:adenosylcobinamide-phosphate synthase CbiB [Limnofasciculus baicalensis]|uniref:Cobalamin biosynthesis protein CobD n=1 Tax=Limnofasciculus baicalensis BBK-W-15 TaxID=2699891 RepID=A0AAE3GZD7_9CYAN|nr:adenosylcobinamide-phosphate synthase CbiB [Limnofasciculus baicalensis]MCP2731407.1 adenosylcobinamide-phosphate synthase CbiB [Limnofasciculus baicalensis BBK-W-15]
MSYITESRVLLLAASLDYLIGDPWGWPHPVRVMGWIISQWTQLVITHCHGKWQRRLAGVGLGIGLILSSGLVGWLILRGANYLNPLFGISLEAVMLASCLAGKSLRGAAVDVLQPLSDGQIDLARSKLSLYVGRDTEKLSEPEILRAVLETVTENATDGVMAPLFYGIVGAFLPGVGSVPLALAYKAASTLDSMVGYREEPYQDLGWFSAKLEDYLTWLPCRLTVITLALLSGKPQKVLNLCRRDGVKDSSPNSGWSECAYAAILGVQVGGTNWYRGIAKHKPLLGDSVEPITQDKIYQALGLTRYSILIWLAIGICLLHALG